MSGIGVRRHGRRSSEEEGKLWSQRRRKSWSWLEENIAGITCIGACDHGASRRLRGDLSERPEGKQLTSSDCGLCTTALK